MGLYDRDYSKEKFQHGFHHAPQMRINIPSLTPAVKWLIIINVAVFFVENLFFKNNVIAPGLNIPINWLERWFSVFPYSVAAVLQIWRLVTYQFLHGGILHILFNMLGLFFLGPTLERHWKTKKFLIFYLCCGVAGGIFYPILVAIKFLQPVPMIGASGAILGMLAACAILFPHFVVFFFIFPVPIRVASVILTFLYVANLVTQGANAGGDAAHLAGMAAGVCYVLSDNFRSRLRFRIKSRKWERYLRDQATLQKELDRILEKVHKYGIQSLSSKEKRVLKQATKAQQQQH